MNSLKQARLTAIFLFLSTIVTAQTPPPKGPYLGQIPPGKIPVIFAPGFISNKNVVGCTFHPNGREFYFCRFISGTPYLMFTQKQASGWTEPAFVQFNRDFFGGPPFISPDGSSFIWRAKRPFPADWPGVKPQPGSREELVYWNMQKTGAEWSAPAPFLLPFPDNFRLHGISLSLDSTIYTCHGNAIFKIAYKNQAYTEPETVISGYPGAYPAIAPDESFLVFTKQGNPRQLMVIFRNTDNSWTQPVSLGETINKPGMNGYPYISFDGKYLFYTSNHNLYWISTEFLEDLRTP